MPNNLQPILSGNFFHIYNRAIGTELLFENDKDYLHWIELLKKYLLSVCDIHAYCLLPNHYHLLVKIHEVIEASVFSKKMAHAANAYAKWKNLTSGRKGGLFMTPFKRKLITDENYLIWCLWYIHRNPVHHGFTKDWQDWKYSSFNVYSSNKFSLLSKDFFINLFGSKELFLKHHLIQSGDYNIINKISIE